jgi:DNA polymerase I
MERYNMGTIKAGKPAFSFGEVWKADFEFQLDGGLHLPLCMVAQEHYTGKEIRLWRDELQALKTAPWNISDSCFVAFVTSAELNCFIALGWPLPEHVLDLAQEHKLSINYDGGKEQVGWSLVKALIHHGLTHLMADEKSAMIDLILSNKEYTSEEKISILEYCAADVTALGPLLDKMLPNIDLPRAIGFRGRYMKAVARMESNGVPFDTLTYEAILSRLPEVKLQLIESGDIATQSYEKGSFNHKLFGEFLARQGLEWDKTPSGLWKMDADYVKVRANGFPLLRDFHELQTTLTLMRGFSNADNRRSRRLMPSTDGMIRCSLWPFGSITCRNTPKAAQFIFGPSTWLRGLIKPPAGYSVAYIDWTSQEFAIAAGLSGDAQMIEDYQSGDVYTAFAISAGLLKKGETNEDIRNSCKQIVLGMAYGKWWYSIARDANISENLAKRLYDSNKLIYKTFWHWLGRVMATAQETRYIDTKYGWRQIITHTTNERAMMNYPMQGNGASMMQLAAIGATEAGIHVCCPVHDAFLIMARTENIEAEIARMRHIMRDASIKICGFEVRSEFKTFSYPERYSDKRGISMWSKIMKLIGDV